MIIKKYLSVICFSMAALALFAGSSFAQQQTVKVSHGGTYFEFGAGVMLFDVPEVNSHSSAITEQLSDFIRQPRDPFDFDFTEATGFLRLGHKVGDRTWIEASFQAARSIRSSLGSQTLGVSEFYDIFGIGNGLQDSSLAGSITVAETVTAQSTSSLKYHDSSLQARRQYNVGSVQVIPLVGLSYTHLDTKISFNGTGPSNAYTLNETLETSFWGIVLGAEVNRQFGPLTRVYGDVRASAVFSDTDFRGRQLFDGVAFPGSQAYETDDTTGFRGSAMVGVETGVKNDILGHILFGLEARADHWTHTPKIVNPMMTGGNSLTPPFLTPAHIGYGSMTNVSVTAHVTMPFGN